MQTEDGLSRFPYKLKKIYHKQGTSYLSLSLSLSLSMALESWAAFSVS
jgi:hypothetical protein